MAENIEYKDFEKVDIHCTIYLKRIQKKINIMIK